MTYKQETLIYDLISDFTDYLEKIASHPHKPIDARFIIQEQTLAALTSDFHAQKANLTSRQASQIISALNAYSSKSRVEFILRLTFLQNVKRLKNHLVSKGINPSNLSTIRSQVSAWEVSIGRLSFPLAERADLARGHRGIEQ